MRFIFFLASAVVMLAAAGAVHAQAVVPERDCQTLLTCKFQKGGSYRGCVSSYSCRYCSFVKARCTQPNASGKVCRELRCTWG